MYLNITDKDGRIDRGMVNEVVQFYVNQEKQGKDVAVKQAESLLLTYAILYLAEEYDPNAIAAENILLFLEDGRKQIDRETCTLKNNASKCNALSKHSAMCIDARKVFKLAPVEVQNTAYFLLSILFYNYTYKKIPFPVMHTHAEPNRKPEKTEKEDSFESLCEMFFGKERVSEEQEIMESLKRSESSACRNAEMSEKHARNAGSTLDLITMLLADPTILYGDRQK